MCLYMYFTLPPLKDENEEETKLNNLLSVFGMCLFHVNRIIWTISLTQKCSLTRLIEVGYSPLTMRLCTKIHFSLFVPIICLAELDLFTNRLQGWFL